MTAAAGPGPARTPASRTRPSASFLRLLRIELRRSPMPLILPLIAALFWFDSYRPSSASQPLYPLLTFWNMGQGHTIVDFGPFVAGVAAWMGSRDGRRGTADLVTATGPAALGGSARRLGGHRDLGRGGLPGVCRRDVRGLRRPGRPGRAALVVGGGRRHRRRGVQRGRVRRRGAVPSRFAAPLAAFGGFLALIMSAQSGFAHQRVGADPADELQRQLPARTRGCSTPTCRICRSRGSCSWPGSRSRRSASWGCPCPGGAGCAGLRRRHGGRGRGGGNRGGPGQHRQARAARHRHPRAARRGQRPPIGYTPVCASARVPVCVNPAYRSAGRRRGGAGPGAQPRWRDCPAPRCAAVQAPAVYDSSEGQAASSDDRG